jgi:hypothetical protein
MSAENEVKVKGVADITFLVDSTGSMKPCIDALKANIEKFCGDISGGNYTTDWRARVIGYRDAETDGSDWIIGRDQPFVNTAADLKGQIGKLEARGGGLGTAEIPESGTDALWIAMHEGDWRPAGKAHRLIIVLTDAPTKPKMVDDTVGGGGKPNDVMAVANYAATEHFKLMIHGPASTEWDLLGKVPKSTFYDITKGGTSDLYDGLRNQNWDKIMETIAKTVSQPIKAPVVAATPPADAPVSGEPSGDSADVAPLPPPPEPGQGVSTQGPIRTMKSQ